MVAVNNISNTIEITNIGVTNPLNLHKTSKPCYPGYFNNSDNGLNSASMALVGLGSFIPRACGMSKAIPIHKYTEKAANSRHIFFFTNPGTSNRIMTMDNTISKAITFLHPRFKILVLSVVIFPECRLAWLKDRSPVGALLRRC